MPWPTPWTNYRAAYPHPPNPRHRHRTLHPTTFKAITTLTTTFCSTIWQSCAASSLTCAPSGLAWSPLARFPFPAPWSFRLGCPRRSWDLFTLLSNACHSVGTRDEEAIVLLPTLFMPFLPQVSLAAPDAFYLIARSMDGPLGSIEVASKSW